MNEKFYDLKKEKQDKMINGAMQIFARYGYRHASTDEMVKVSGVSKGLWFHYFENKKGLYTFVTGYALKYAILELSMVVDAKETDYFKLMIQMERGKMNMMEKYPFLPLFLVSLSKERDEEAISLIQEARERYDERISEIMIKADYSKIRAKAETGKVNKMITYTLEALTQEYYESAIFRKEQYLEEADSYLQMIKSLTYR
ncbi:MAG TPA: TetR/AcrR family transcriptional regulator [Lachnospiraceae bacterium]|nr:TetR/AcrR family transcriptional regulator [Lachnospiraceae bacterium]HPF30252.1 TetR/AcrR family transcriptional regulator [Lachnospiraceae bacterium]